jgi:hypothetical protein
MRTNQGKENDTTCDKVANRVEGRKVQMNSSEGCYEIRDTADKERGYLSILIRERFG